MNIRGVDPKYESSNMGFFFFFFFFFFFGFRGGIEECMIFANGIQQRRGYGWGTEDDGY